MIHCLKEAVFLTQKKKSSSTEGIKIVEMEPSITLIHGEASVLQLTSKQEALPKSLLYWLFSSI
jgi:hypothetical protein